jgi:hypothetical protein
MSSPAPKQAETEFDDLLGQLVDELAMTPASESAVQLVPDPLPAEARVDSTHHMAAEAAAAAAAAAANSPAPQSDNSLVKVVGIIAGSLTIVAVVALAVFAGDGRSATTEPVPTVDVDSERLAAIAATEQAAAARAKSDRMAAERAEITARSVRIEAGLLADELKAKAEEEAKASKPRKRTRKPKPKKPKPKPGDSFDDL